jgi:hypothetical protein
MEGIGNHGMDESAVFHFGETIRWVENSQGSIIMYSFASE